MLFKGLCGGILSLALAAGAHAGVIQDHIDGLDPTETYFDFREAAIYGSCAGQNSCTQEESNAENRAVTISADVLVGGAARLLYRDNKDGFGIKGNENDEIDSDEVLTVLFDGGWIPTELGLTDLFGIGDGGSDGEEAIVRGFFDGVLVYELRFQGLFAPDEGNGEAIFGLPGLAVDYLEFHSVEDPALSFFDLEGVTVGQSDDEYSVAYIAGSPIPPIITTTTGVPEPGMLALFGAGLLGLGVLARRRR